MKYDVPYASWVTVVKISQETKVRSMLSNQPIEKAHLFIMPVKRAQVAEPSSFLNPLEICAKGEHQAVGNGRPGLICVLQRGTTCPPACLISLVPMRGRTHTLVGGLSIAEQPLQPIARLPSCQHVQWRCYILQYRSHFPGGSGV